MKYIIALIAAVSATSAFADCAEDTYSKWTPDYANQANAKACSIAESGYNTDLPQPGDVSEADIEGYIPPAPPMVVLDPNGNVDEGISTELPEGADFTHVASDIEIYGILGSESELGHIYAYAADSDGPVIAYGVSEEDALDPNNIDSILDAAAGMADCYVEADEYLGVEEGGACEPAYGSVF